MLLQAKRETAREKKKESERECFIDTHAIYAINVAWGHPLFPVSNYPIASAAKCNYFFPSSNCTLRCNVRECVWVGSKDVFLNSTIDLFI